MFLKNKPALTSAACGVLWAAVLGTLLGSHPVAAQTASPTPVPTVGVARWEVQGNTLLPPAQLAQVLAAYTGNLNLQRLRAAAAAVQEEYRRAGYGGVVAFLPEQDLSGGLGRIRVVEGKLTRVEVVENKQFSAENVRRSLPSLKVGSTPQVRRIDAEIQLANENPAKTVTVLLQPGAAAGDVAANVSVQEQPVQRLTARLDNTGGKAIGRWRAALGWQHANLWELDHVFAGELQTAPENTSAVKVASGSYRAPLYGRAMALDGYFAWSDVNAGSVEIAGGGDLQFSGKGTIVGLRWQNYLPRLGNVDQRVILGLEAREYLNTCSINGSGTCGAAGASVSLQPLSLSYTAQAQGELRWGVNLGLHQNLGAGGRYGSDADFEAVRPGSERRYTLLRGAAQLGFSVGQTLQLQARLNLQAAGKPLVPGEMFGIGGAQSVRGFEERELSGDSGASLTLEASSNNLLPEGSKARGMDLRAIGFADAGTVQNQQDAPCLAGKSSCRMGSLGLGLRGQWQLWQLRLDLARAMSTATSTNKGDTRAHFSLATLF